MGWCQDTLGLFQPVSEYVDLDIPFFFTSIRATDKYMQQNLSVWQCINTTV